MKMALAYSLALGSTTAMASLHAVGIAWIAVDAVLVAGIVGGIMGAPFVMDHPDTRSAAHRRTRP